MTKRAVCAGTLPAQRVDHPLDYCANSVPGRWRRCAYAKVLASTPTAFLVARHARLTELARYKPTCHKRCISWHVIASALLRNFLPTRHSQARCTVYLAGYCRGCQMLRTPPRFKAMLFGTLKAYLRRKVAAANVFGSNSSQRKLRWRLREKLQEQRFANATAAAIAAEDTAEAILRKGTTGGCAPADWP